MGKNNKEIDYIEPPSICRYCESPVVYTSNAEIYGREYGNGKCYLCRNCGAYVGVHTGTLIPLGTLANYELRKARNKAHIEFDKLWKSPTRIMTRYEAYKKLADIMNKDIKYTHIALFEVEECQKVLKAIKQIKMNLGEKK